MPPIKLAAAFLGCVIGAMGQPVVTGVLNAAGYQRPPKGDAPIAQGSMFVVFGNGLAGPDFTQPPGFPLPTTLPSGNGTAISITSGGQNIPAYVVYTLANQVAAILPSATPIGPASLTLTYNGQASASFNINVTRSAPGIFTANAQGSGPAAAQIAFSSSDVRPINLTTPAPPGSIVTLYGTGLGPLNVPDNMPPGAVVPGGTVTATIGGKSAVVLYAGRTPQFPGEDQINIQLPADVPLGCYTPGVIAVNGVPSNDFVLSTAAAGTNSCDHPMGLSAASEATLDAGGTVNVGVFSMIRGTIEIATSEGLGGLFATVNAGQLWAAFQSLLWNTHVVPYPAPAGDCVVYDQLVSAATTTILPDSFTAIGGRELQSASTLMLNGFSPSSVSKPSLNYSQIVGKTAGSGPGYLWTSNLTGPAVPAKLNMGNWSLSADPGPDISVFSASIQLPLTLLWTGLTGLTAPSQSGVTMTWTGGYCPMLFPCPMPLIPPNVNIFGNSSVWNPSDPSMSRGKSFSCAIPAPDTIFAIPPAVLAALPVPGPLEVGVGSLGMSASDITPFVALMTNGQRTDGGALGFSELQVNTGTGFAWK